jgi:hypothetical protein
VAVNSLDEALELGTDEVEDESDGPREEDADDRGIEDTF